MGSVTDSPTHTDGKSAKAVKYTPICSVFGERP